MIFSNTEWILSHVSFIIYIVSLEFPSVIILLKMSAMRLYLNKMINYIICQFLIYRWLTIHTDQWLWNFRKKGEYNERGKKM